MPIIMSPEKVHTGVLYWDLTSLSIGGLLCINVDPQELHTGI